MDAHQRGLAGFDLALLQHHVLAIFGGVGIGFRQPFAAVPAFQLGFGDALHQPVVGVAIGDQIADGADLQAVAAGERDQIGQARHGAIVVHDLADHTAGAEAGEARDVHAGFGMASAHQHAAIAGDEREDMAGRNDMFRAIGGIDGHRDGAGAIGRRNAGGDAFLGFDRHGEGRAVAGAVVLRHKRQAECLHALRRQSKADQAAAKLGHEVDGIGRRHLAGDDQVAFVFAVFIVDQDIHAAVAGLVDDILDGGQSRPAAAIGQPVFQFPERVCGRVPLGFVQRAQAVGMQPGSAGHAGF